MSCKCAHHKDSICKNKHACEGITQTFRENEHRSPHMNLYLQPRKCEECLSECWSSLCSQAFGAVSSCTQKMSPLVLYYCGYFGDTVSLTLITHCYWVGICPFSSLRRHEVLLLWTLETFHWWLSYFLATLTGSPDTNDLKQEALFWLVISGVWNMVGEGGICQRAAPSLAGEVSDSFVSKQTRKQEIQPGTQLQVTASRACPWAHFC